MDKLPQAHAWATLIVSFALIVLFTLSVALLSHGLIVLALFSATLIFTGIYCMYRYSRKKTPPDFKILALLNLSLIFGFIPGIGMKYMQLGVVGPYLWLSLVTINLAYSMAVIIYYDIKLSKILR